MSTHELIEPIIVRTYGTSPMTKAMVEHLASKIERGDFDHYDSREDMIRSVCWDWMTGGSTAEVVAQRIEAVLPASSPLASQAPSSPGAGRGEDDPVAPSLLPGGATGGSSALRRKEART